MAGVIFEDVAKAFRRQDGTPLPVLEGIGLAAGQGEFCCLVGPSGCGKSTLLNIAAGLVAPDRGRVRFEGMSGVPRIGYVFQRARLLNWRTVRGNLAFALEAWDIPSDTWRARIDHYLRLVGLEQFADEYPLALSGGMQQRVALARALCIEPEVLLMDEPFSHLDELTARSLRREVTRLWRETKVTILFVTHNALEAAYLADRIHLLTARPARLAKSLTMEVPRDREMEDPQVVAVAREVVRALEAPAR